MFVRLLSRFWLEALMILAIGVFAGGFIWRGQVIQKQKAQLAEISAQIKTANDQATREKELKDRAVTLAETGLAELNKTLGLANDAIAKENAAQSALVSERTAAAKRLRDAYAAAGGRGSPGQTDDLATIQRSIQAADSWRALALSCESLAGSGGSILVDLASVLGSAQSAGSEAARLATDARARYAALESAVVVSGCAKSANLSN
jgi:hypothetical protein